MDSIAGAQIFPQHISSEVKISTDLNGLLPLLQRLDRLIQQAISALQSQEAIEEPKLSWLEPTEILPLETASVQIRKDSPLAWLKKQFCLSDFDLDLMAIALAPELDRQYVRIYAYLQDDMTKKRPTVDLALNLLCSTLPEKLSQRKHFTTNSPLISHNLLHLCSEPQTQPATLLGHSLTLDDQVVRFLLQQPGLDFRLTDCCQIIQPNIFAHTLYSKLDIQPGLEALFIENWQQKQPLLLYFSGCDRFRLTPDQITDAVATASNNARWQSLQTESVSNYSNEKSNHHKTKEPPSSFLTLCSAARTQSSLDLGILAYKIEPKYTWDDIILRPNQLKQLEDICKESEYRDLVHRQWGFADKLSLGKGLNALFSGASGTGKTMAAEVIAKQLQLDLYKIDLSQIISKYIGETEKNLNRIFTAATNSNAILLFDEADALFGKRSEVQDARDRYANIEVGYLLQKMEEYEGIAILTTNFRDNIDKAFERRLRFIIKFHLPDAQNRYLIWQKIFPKNAPCDSSLDLKFLAQNFEITGASIRNIALTAAFLAADDHEVIEMIHIIQAIQREYQKMGHVLRDRDLGEYVKYI